jgi:hypothetical protein
MEKLDLRVQVGVRFRIRVLESHTDRGHLSACLLEGNARTETRDYAHLIKYPVRRIISGRDEGLDFMVRKKEPRRHDADYIPQLAAQRNGTAHDVRIGSEQVLPTVVAQDDNVFLGGKAAAE